ncbi:hypothetical protein GQ53DRAFT_669990 [Thozetella sp. PMI_491]|nr:hypothetical protein GQ53DRAFT_669990 [Thozetella sp. PMI_491]
MTRARSATASDSVGTNGQTIDFLPSIRFSTFYDPRATRPSLTFPPISRTLPTGGEIIRVGRYSERDNAANIPVNVPSAAPVGFKSKVVSRRHCEFWYENGKWYIKDVKSSSGTFLNHIRLSPPGTESKPFPINDGDIVQLGIDFKGGEEMIFRCVKMRLELNRGWQNKLNTFNMTTHKRLRNMTNSSGNNNSGQTYSQDCSICLNSIAPCQCLFVAPCSHTWHYKCIRALLAGPSYPIFICPNCRAAADLEAEVEDPEEWEQLESDEGEQRQLEGAPVQNGESLAAEDTTAPPRKSRESTRSLRLQRAAPGRSPVPPTEQEMSNGEITVLLDAAPEVITHADGAGPQDGSALVAHQPVAPNATSEPVPIPSPAAGAIHRVGTDDGSSLADSVSQGGVRSARTPSPPGAPTNGHEGPITPRNDAGPWVFDGSGVRIRVSGDGGARVTSLEAAVSSGAGPHPDSMEIS